MGPLTFRTLSGRPVLTDLFDPQSDAAVEHVALAERAAAVIVAPATANLLAKAAHGIADDFLTTLLLAAPLPGGDGAGDGRRHVGASGGRRQRGHARAPAA